MPASAVTRLNSITYGGFAIGVGTNYHLHSVFLFQQDYTQLTIRALVVCHHDTEATFVTECSALEAAFRVPNGNLIVVIGGSTPYSLSHSGNTGTLGQPSVKKPGSSLDSNNTRLYQVSVTVQLPADEAGKSGRQSADVSYTEAGSEIVRLDVVAVYTGIAGNDALAQAKANFPTYVTALQGVEGGTWDELDARQYRHDSDDKVCRVTASYQQVIANQSASGLNDTSLQGVQMSVVTKELSVPVEKGSGARPPVEVTISFFARVRKSQSTDLKTVWENTVRPHMIDTAESLSGLSGLTVVESTPALDPQNNVIQARMTFVTVRISLISSDLFTSEVELMDVKLEPVLTGNGFDRDLHFRVPRKVVTITASILEVDTASDRALGGYRAAITLFKRLGYTQTDEAKPVDRRTELNGQGLSRSLRMRQRRMVAVMERANIIGGQLKTRTR